MKILIVGALDPHDNQVEKRLCEAISAWYTSHGHTTDICYLPFKMDYHGIHEQILAYRLITTYPESEMLVTIGYPAFALKHPNKHVLLLKFLPEFHVNYNTEFGYMEQWYRIQKDQRIWKNLLQTEKVCLREAKSVHCASAFLADEVASLGCETGVFGHIPFLNQTDKSLVNQEEYIVQSCLAPMDRLDLLLEAVKVADVKVRIFIPSAEDCYINAVKARVTRLFISNKVQICRKEIGTGDLKACRGVVCLCRGSEYVPPWVYYAVKASIPVVVATDGGALHEENNCGSLVAVDPKLEMVVKALKEQKKDKEISTTIQMKLSGETTALLERWVK